MGISRVLLKEMPLSRKPLVLAAHPNSFHSCALLLSPLASSHNTCKEAVLSIQTHYLFCFLSSLVMSYSALLWPFWFPRCLHFTSTFPVRGRKHCKTRQPGVCGALLLPFTGLVDSTNKIKVIKIQSVGAGLRTTSMLCWNWIPFSSSDPAKTIDYFEKHQMLSFF